MSLSLGTPYNFSFGLGHGLEVIQMASYGDVVLLSPLVSSLDAEYQYGPGWASLVFNSLHSSQLGYRCSSHHVARGAIDLVSSSASSPKPVSLSSTSIIYILSFGIPLFLVASVLSLRFKMHKDVQSFARQEVRWPLWTNRLAAVTLVVESMQLSAFLFNPEVPWADEHPIRLFLQAFVFSFDGWLMVLVFFVFASIGIAFAAVIFGMWLAARALDKGSKIAQAYLIMSSYGLPLAGSWLLLPLLRVLLGMLSCIRWSDDVERVASNSQIVCWTTQHVVLTIIACLSLAAFYPLSTRWLPAWQKLQRETLDIHWRPSYLVLNAQLKVLLVGSTITAQHPIVTVVTTGSVQLILLFLGCGMRKACNIRAINRARVLLLLLSLWSTVCSSFAVAGFGDTIPSIMLYVGVPVILLVGICVLAAKSLAEQAEREHARGRARGVETPERTLAMLEVLRGDRGQSPKQPTQSASPTTVRGIRVKGTGYQLQPPRTVAGALTWPGIASRPEDHKARRSDDRHETDRIERRDRFEESDDRLEALHSAERTGGSRVLLEARVWDALRMPVRLPDYSPPPPEPVPTLSSARPATLAIETQVLSDRVQTALERHRRSMN